MTLGMVILGRQGSERNASSSHSGTVSNRSYFNRRHVAVCCARGTELGLKAKSIMDSGGLVTDDVVNGIVAERLAKDDVQNSGFLLDGYPRTVGQATELKQLVGDSLKLAINLDVSIEEVTQRMMSRGREDDTPEAIARRLELYEAETAPLIEWFENENILCVIDGLGTEIEVHRRVIEEIQRNI